MLCKQLKKSYNHAYFTVYIINQVKVFPMNIAYKRVSALVFSAIVTTSVVGMENENMIEQATEQVTPAAWYKKGSVQAAVAAITLAAVGYACAVRMNKEVVPTFV